MKILYYRRQVFYCVAILMMVTLLLLLLILLFVSCKASNDKYLEQCLILAGKNRIEFEKVLNHYKNDPLKIEAAKFLIRNMSDEISVFQTYYLFR